MKDIYIVDGPRMVKIMFVNKSSISFTEARTSRNKIFLLSMVGYDINSTNIVRLETTHNQRRNVFRQLASRVWLRLFWQIVNMNI